MSKLKELGQLSTDDKEFILSMLDKLISAFIKRGEKEKELKEEKPKEAAVVETKEGIAADIAFETEKELKVEKPKEAVTRHYPREEEKTEGKRPKEEAAVVETKEGKDRCYFRRCKETDAIFEAEEAARAAKMEAATWYINGLACEREKCEEEPACFHEYSDPSDGSLYVTEQRRSVCERCYGLRALRDGKQFFGKDKKERRQYYEKYGNGGYD